MKIYEKKIIPAQEKEVCSGTVCDLCKTPDKEWNTNGNLTEIVVKHKWGNTYPDGGLGEKIDIDLCPNCFNDVLVPFLKERGAEIKTTEWDY